MVDGETGYISDPDDTQRVSKAIVTLIQDMDLSRKMGTQARKRIISNFTQGQIAEKNIKYYKRITSV